MAPSEPRRSRIGCQEDREGEDREGVTSQDTMSFVERNDLWTVERQEAARGVERLIETRGIEVVRISFPDQHGLLRGKTIVAGDATKLMRAGVSITSSLLAKDTANRTVLPIWSAGGAF